MTDAKVERVEVFKFNNCLFETQDQLLDYKARRALMEVFPIMSSNEAFAARLYPLIKDTRKIYLVLKGVYE